MTEAALTHYALGTAGEIRHWLRSGPVSTVLTNLREVIRPDGSPFGRDGRWAISNAPDSLGLKVQVDQWLPPEEWRPGGRPALFGEGPAPGTRWDYAATDEDQVVDFSLFNFSPTRMDAWTYAGLVAETAQEAAGDLLTVGPARVWLNGVRILEHAGFEYVQPAAVPLILPLSAGWNDLWVHGRMIGWREARLALGLRVRVPAQVLTGLPLGGVPAARWGRAAEEMSRLSVRRFEFSDRAVRFWLDRAAPAPLDVLAEVVPSPPPTVFPGDRGMRQPERPIASAQLRVAPGEAASLSSRASGDDRAALPFEKGWRLRLSPSDGTPFRVEREIWLRADGVRASAEPAADPYDARRHEGLAYAALMPKQVVGALAAVEIGRARLIEPEAVGLACDFLEQRCDCADFYAIDLLALLHRLADPSALRPADHRRIEAAFRGFKFWIDEPGVDGMCYHTENHQILFHVAAYLAGQRWPDVVFDNSGWTGRTQMRRAKPRIREWIVRRLRGGFSEWDSNTYLALDAYAMLALAEFAANDLLRRMATAMLHKIFFVLACQSWRGVHGASHGRTYVASLKTARAENTSGLQRIAWGLGGFGAEVRATGLLSLARRYRVPDALQWIGADLPELLVTRAHSAGRFRAQYDLRREHWQVSTLTRRTPDFMLAAALDQRPGAVGIQEHLWQATLGPDAVVFTTHPGNSQEHENARPNFWAGSTRLPRVTMADDAVLCVYDLSLGGGLPFTHAYFPSETFDEYVLDGPWAFARVHRGYVGLWGDGDLRLTAAGPHTAQELRSAGPGRAWACRAARAATDGEFGQFCRTMRAHAPRIADGRVSWSTPSGRALELAWTGPLVVDGRPFDPTAFPHYDNLYTHTPMGAAAMDVASPIERLHLDLVKGWATSDR